MERGQTLHVADDVTVAHRVRLVRMAVGMSRREMAQAIGVSRRTYERVETGARDLRVSEAYALAAVTGQDVVFFGASFSEVAASGPHPLPGVKAENGDENEPSPPASS